MIEIKDLLSRLSNILISEERKIETIQKVISQTTGIVVQLEDIKIKNHSIYLNIKPIYKNEIFIKQEEIYILLEETLGNKVPKKIK